MENYCKYRSIKYLNNSDIDNRLKHLYKGMCYLLGQSGSTPVVPDATVDFSVNANPNTGGTTFSPNTPNLTTVIYVSTIDGSQWTSNGTTYTLYVAPYWAKTGNIGTTPGTHFLGTTDNKGLMFKANNKQSGYIDLVNTNTSFGYRSVLSNISGVGLTAFGQTALFSNTTGTYSTALGLNALYYNTTGANNTALGYTALQANTTGIRNLGVGQYAGAWNTSASNQIFINTINRASYAGDQTESPIYIQQNATVANQNIFLNGLMNLSYVPTYVDNAAALLGGLVAGNIYKINVAGTYTLAIVV